MISVSIFKKLSYPKEPCRLHVYIENSSQSNVQASIHSSIKPLVPDVH